MINSMSSAFCSAILLLCLVVMDFQRAAAGARAESCGSLLDSCQNYKFGDETNGWFTADCGGGGTTKTVQINLNEHIGNFNGKLVEGREFSTSCKNILQDGYPQSIVVQADCGNRMGRTIFSTKGFDLIHPTVHVVYKDGSLRWGSC